MDWSLQERFGEPTGRELPNSLIEQQLIEKLSSTRHIQTYEDPS